MADYSIVNANTENKLINSTDGIATIYVDDVVQETPATTYKFTTTGYHRVKFELTEPTEIPESLFFGSSHLKNVTIPHQVETINTRAFYSCSELTEVHCLSLIPPALGTNVFDGGHAERKIYVAATVVDTYKNAPGWSQYASEIYPLQ